MHSLAVACLLLVTTSAYAQTGTPEPPTAVQNADRGRDTGRVMVALSGATFASYPMSREDPGPALVVGKPLWLGLRHRFFQWVADGNVLVGFGTSSKHVHLAVTPQFGFNLYLGSVFGFEFREGAAVIMQAGQRTVAGIGLSASGGYVFRFWDDDRRRLKVLMVMHIGGYFAADPGNDLGMNANALGICLAYETPF